MISRLRKNPRLDANSENDQNWMILNAGKLIMDIPQFEADYNLKHHTHVVKFFFGPTCRHCKRIMPIIEARMKQETEFLYLPVNAMSRQGGKQLQSLGYNSVPLVVVDERYEIHTETRFLERFDKVLKIVKQIPLRRNIFESIR